MKIDLQQIKQRFGIIGNSVGLNRAIDVALQVAPTDLSVLITGESGVGKELIANALHNLSSRRDKPFIKVHCAALSETLLESELFGHEKGSFTSAIKQKKGRLAFARRPFFCFKKWTDIKF